MVGIYKFTNKITGDSYIGQSTNIHKRYINHKNHCDPQGKHFENTLFHRNIAKYGFDNFEFSVLEECKREELDEKEIFYISLFDTLSPHGYNVNNGGNSPNLIGLKTVDDERQIKVLLKNTGLSNSEIGAIFGVSDQTISDINNGRTWKRKGEHYPIRPLKKKKDIVCCNCGKTLNFINQSMLCRDCYNKRIGAYKPTKEELYDKLCEYNFTQVGKQFGVTGNAVVKWCKGYEIPHHASYYRQLKFK